MPGSRKIPVPRLLRASADTDFFTFTSSHMAVHHLRHLHYHHFYLLLLVQSFILNSRISHIILSGHPSAACRAQDRESSPAKTDVLPLCYATNRVGVRLYSSIACTQTICNLIKLIFTDWTKKIQNFASIFGPCRRWVTLVSKCRKSKLIGLEKGNRRLTYVFPKFPVVRSTQLALMVYFGPQKNAEPVEGPPRNPRGVTYAQGTHVMMLRRVKIFW